MNILFIEPFFSGSHKSWLTQLQRHSSHRIEILSMEGKFWKWRMYGASYTMAEALALYEGQADVVIASDMIDLAAFAGIARRDLARLGNPKLGMYFHENQFAYPWQEQSEDRQMNRDVHYGMANYTSALAADFVLFNSAHNRETFLAGAAQVLARMPDYKHGGTIEAIQGKSAILPIGIEPPRRLGPEERAAFRKEKGIPLEVPVLLWNHRLEHDKNPEAFFRALVRLKAEGVAFKVLLLGDLTPQTEEAYGSWLEDLGDCIAVRGHQRAETYHKCLNIGDVAFVTSLHDFFGISVMEAVACGCRPLLPRRLTYPELYDASANPELFYGDDEEGYGLLRDLLLGWGKEEGADDGAGREGKDYSALAAPYLWENLIGTCDRLLGGQTPLQFNDF